MLLIYYVMVVSICRQSNDIYIFIWKLGEKCVNKIVRIFRFVFSQLMQIIIYYICMILLTRYHTENIFSKHILYKYTIVCSFDNDES